MDRPLAVLVADDEPEVLELAELLLRAAGYDVVTAVDGEKALDAVYANDPDHFQVAVLDVNMPRVDGIGVAAELRRHRPHLKIILNTSMSEEFVRQRSADFDAYLAKFDLSDYLVDMVCQLAATERSATDLRDHASQDQLS